jgi:hypothetical protein
MAPSGWVRIFCDVGGAVFAVCVSGFGYLKLRNIPCWVLDILPSSLSVGCKRESHTRGVNGGIGLLFSRKYCYASSGLPFVVGL